jgi:DNA-binding response OmpR family regulator
MLTTNMNALLIFGHDASLLRSRAMLLRKRGYEVFTVTNLSEIEDIPVAVGLMILCHTLGQHDCASALALARQKWPKMQSILLSALGKAPCSLGLESVLTSDGPAKLLSAVDECFGRRVA